MKILFLAIYSIIATAIFLSLSSFQEPNSQLPDDHCANYFENVPIIGGGINNFNSFRNNHYKIVIPKDNSTISISVKITGANGKIYLLDDAGNYLTYSSEGTNVAIDKFKIRNEGNYIIVINSENQGIYSLDICGDVLSAEPLIADVINFNAGNWNPAGGINHYNSWRNKHFSIDVKEDNSYIDFIAKSQGLSCKIYILNSAGEYITYSSEGTDVQIIAFKIVYKGTYSIVICGEDDNIGTFDLSMVSKSGVIQNAKKINSTNFNPHSGAWNPGGGMNNYISPKNDKYFFTVSKTTHIDLVAKAAGANAKIYILNSANDYITYSSEGLQPTITQYKITPGDYSAVLTTGENKSGTYNLIIYSKEGTISDLIPK